MQNRPGCAHPGRFHIRQTKETRAGATARALRQNTGWPLITLGSQVENAGKYVTMLIALKIAR
jgi:hypothetical protein